MKQCILFCVIIGVIAPPTIAGVRTFRNDYAGFASTAGDLSVIDFETLPNGQPSIVGTPITASFNYDAQDAHFTGYEANPAISGNPTAGYGLRVSRRFTWERTWLTADLTVPIIAVGIFFAGGTEMCVHGTAGEELGCVLYSGSFSGNFLGIVADGVIARVVVDRGISAEDIESFHFAAVPEPTCLMLISVALFCASRRRWRKQ